MNLYDLLDVEPDASSEDIHRAWKDAISDLGPGDRRFRSYNQAAEVLLDPERRAAHDAALAEQDAEPEPEIETEPVVAAPVVLTKTTQPTKDTTQVTGSVDEAAPVRTGGRSVPTVLLAVVGTVAAVVLAATIWAWTGLDRGDAAVADEDVDAAIAAAEEAAVPVLSFDYRDLDADIVDAESFMTADYAAQHSQLMNDLRRDIVSQQTVVDAQVMGSAVVRATGDRADILVLVNQVTEKADGKTFLLPVWATLQMTRADDTWRIDNIVNRGAVAE